MRVRVLIEMDDGGVGIRAVNVLDSAMRAYNEKLRHAVPDAEIDFEVLGVVPEAEVRAGVVAEEPEWEYGVEHVQVDGWVDRELHLNLAEAEEDYRTCGMNCTLMRRRKAGPWLPVKQEGAETDA